MNLSFEDKSKIVKELKSLAKWATKEHDAIQKLETIEDSFKEGYLIAFATFIHELEMRIGKLEGEKE